MLSIGTRVKQSEGSLRKLQDGWLSAGTQETKNRFKRWIEEARAKRGTVVKSGRNSINCPQLDIQWDDGALSYSAPFLVVAAED